MDESHEEETLKAKLEEERERENECVAAASATNPKITTCLAERGECERKGVKVEGRKSD